MSLPSINFLHLTVSKIYPGQDFIGQGHYGKVKSRSHHDVAHLHPLTNVPTKYQLPTPYVSEIQPGQTFSRPPPPPPFPPPEHPPIRTPWVKTVTMTAFKGCGVTEIQKQPDKIKDRHGHTGKGLVSRNYLTQTWT